MGRAPHAASQHGNFMMQGREPMDGRANGNNGSRAQSQQHYFYDDVNEYDQQYDDGNNYNGNNNYNDGNNWQSEYGGFDNFYTDNTDYAEYDESQAGW